MSYLSQLLSLEPESRIVILGLGVENQQFLVWLTEVAKFPTTRIIIADQNPKTGFELNGQSYSLEEYQTLFGSNYLEVLENAEVEWVFKSPGIWSLKYELQWFRERKGQDRVLSSMTFFLEKFRNQSIGITGTKGKSTTCSLITHLLQNKFEGSENSVHYCGNTVGVSPYQFWNDLNQKVDPNTFFVLELSSFQLQDLGFAELSPKYAATTNYFVDHLDQHKHVWEYWKAKDQLFEHQTSEDYFVVGQWLRENDTDRSGDMYANLNEGDRWAKYMMSEPNYDFELLDSVFEDLKKTFTTKLAGAHNWQNLVLALVLYQIVILKPENKAVNSPKLTLTQVLKELQKRSSSQQIQSFINTFQPLTHRLELVHTIQTELLDQAKLTIKFYDDGAATEPDAVIAAIKALTNTKHEFLWLQITGKDKGVPIDNLAEIIKDKAAGKLFRVNLCGAIGLKIKSFYRLPEYVDTDTQSFRDLVESDLVDLNKIKSDFGQWLESQGLSEPNQNYTLNVCLSPCGSSFDEFNNYRERSNWWTAKVKSL